MTQLRTALAALALLSPAALAAAQGVAYVSSEKDNALTIVDLKTLAVTGTPADLQASAPPAALGRRQADAGGLHRFAPGRHHRPGHAASRSASCRWATIPRPSTCRPTARRCTSPTRTRALLSFIDIASGKVAKTVEVGKEPEGVKVSPDGKTVWVTSEVASLVHVIDTASAKVREERQGGQAAAPLRADPRRPPAVGDQRTRRSVTVLSTQDYSTLATLKFAVKGVREADITPVGITMTRDGKRAFVALGKANHVAFVDVAARKVTDLVLVGKRAWNVTLDKAEARLYVVNGLSDDMTVVDVAAAKAIKSIPVGRVPYMALVVE